MKYIISLVITVCFSLTMIVAGEPAVGSALPDLGSLLPGSALPKTAGKVVLVDFWASWCAPCKASFATMSRLHQKYAAQGLVIIGIGVDEEKEKFLSFAAKQQPGFTLVHDAGQAAAGFFNPPTMPTSYLVDRSGKIRHIHKGFKGAKTEAEYTAEIEELLSK
ncbi:thiol-disulfide isomerase/thioredoxin [Prosthecobacter fusiformis]|uniref:Thiol-disulfide isomerase/thioredoxin n=1 Tax=Prosthecobacter fusiformis TaxID=48464 RepID=A0A4R7RPI7_9BACT|nr:TlpA disulfide reductase family protein [Prosthecobacter fusiformis]TDU66167.1 thiol-disulfide isomerase/thioredoxin [Prosthecobacter fusiformis]